jgi:hypothetical protein
LSTFGLCAKINTLFVEKGFWTNPPQGSNAVIFCELDHLTIEINEMLTIANSSNELCDEAADIFIILADIVGSKGRELNLSFDADDKPGQPSPSFQEFLAAKSVLSDTFRKTGFLSIEHANRLVSLLYTFCTVQGIDLMTCVEAKLSKLQQRPNKFGLAV